MHLTLYLTLFLSFSLPSLSTFQLNSFCTRREKLMPLIGTASTAGKAVGGLFSGIASDK